MKLTGESKLLLAIVGITVAIVAAAAILFTKPIPTFTKEDTVGKSTHVKGKSDAKVYLVEFSDFQCPACKAAKPYVDEILATYGDKIYFAYRHFPLTQHAFAQHAAQAAEAASSQGKFWEAYDQLFADQEKFSEAYFKELPTILKLDEQKYNEVMAKKTFQQAIDEDTREGVRLGVAATPTFFLNGTKLELTGFADLKAAIDRALQE